MNFGRLGLLLLAMLCMGHSTFAGFIDFKYFDPSNAAQVPKNLSTLGIYSNIISKTLSNEPTYFEVNSPLWSDASVKRRWIILPQGKSILYRDSLDVFDYPDSSVFVKTFMLELVPGDSSTRKYWETRLLVNKHDGQGLDTWYPLTYRWKSDQSEAVLVTQPKGIDTVFMYYPKGRSNPMQYRKWHFPSVAECFACHNPGKAQVQNEIVMGRAVLGFFAAQLKMPQAPMASNKNQLRYLFDRGVFSGSFPSTRELNIRWKSVYETLSVSGPSRMRAIDTMARAYIASNCSGCHGRRGKANPSQNLPGLDFDFHEYTPQFDFAAPVIKSFSLNNLVPSTDPKSRHTSHEQFSFLVMASGFNTSPGQIWEMNVPFSDSQRVPALVKPGYPALSVILYRQWDRRSHLEDSAATYRLLLTQADFVQDTVTRDIARNRLTWLFSKPWGTEAWFDVLASKGVTVDSLMLWKYLGFDKLDSQMPPLAAFSPDTSAQKILGEWVRNYSGATGITKRLTQLIRQPYLVGSDLHIPGNYSGPVYLYRIQGRMLSLQCVAPGKFALPSTMNPGIFFLKVGQTSYRMSKF